MPKRVRERWWAARLAPDAEEPLGIVTKSREMQQLVDLARRVAKVEPRAVDQLLRYRWPGNVRELENAMERAVALARGSRVELEDLPEEIREAFPKPVVSGVAPQPLREIEKDYVLAVLELNDGNQTRTAAQLGIGSATLYRRLKEYGLIGRRSKRRKRWNDRSGGQR